jgi:hypothetical protein
MDILFYRLSVLMVGDNIPSALFLGMICSRGDVRPGLYRDVSLLTQAELQRFISSFRITISHNVLDVSGLILGCVD